jgi:hypothetical protein
MQTPGSPEAAPRMASPKRALGLLAASAALVGWVVSFGGATP